MAFNEKAKGVFSASQIMTMMNKRGGKTVKLSSFLEGLINVSYCGKIYVEKYNDEEAYFVPSIHEALILEDLFDKIQNGMVGNVNPARSNVKILSDENFPLRGFFICPNCGQLVTGSASICRSSQKYYYYHCKSSCGYRYKSEIVNSKFLKVLQTLEMKESIEKYLKKILKQNFEKFISNLQHERKTILLEIDRLNGKIKLERNKLLKI